VDGSAAVSSLGHVAAVGDLEVLQEKLKSGVFLVHGSILLSKIFLKRLPHVLVQRKCFQTQINFATYGEIF
jgi:hypothetical protein